MYPVKYFHFLCLIIFAFAPALKSQEKSLNFFELSRVNGLSNNNVTAITRDGKGFLWFGTKNGLNRYNGYTFVNYFTSGNDTTTIPGNYISVLRTDLRGRLWVGCLSDGLARFDELADNFIRYDLSGGPGESEPFYVHDIRECGRGIVWAATSHGLFRYDEGADYFERIPVKGGDNYGENDFLEQQGLYTLEKRVLAIAPAPDNSIWIVYAGWEISRLDPSGGTTRHYSSLAGQKIIHETAVNDLFYLDNVLYLATDNHGVLAYDIPSGKSRSLPGSKEMETATGIALHEGLIWISNWNGLISYDPATSGYSHFKADPSNPKSLKAGATNCLFIDDTGILWVGAGNIGISYTMLSLPFGNIHENEEDNKQLYHQNVSAILYDSRGNLWVAFQSGAIQYYQAGENSRTIVQVDPLIPGTGIGHIFTIMETSWGDIYISSWQGGIHRYDRIKKRFVNVVESFDIFLEKFGGVDVRDIAEDPEGNLWLAVFRKGVVKYCPDRKKVRNFSHGPGQGGLTGSYPYDVGFDIDGNLWVSTSNGLNRMPPGDSVFVNYYPSDDKGLVDHYFTFSYRDREGRMWFASGGGLSLYDPAGDHFVTFSKELFGYPDMILRALEQDMDGVFWLATCSGLIRIEFNFTGMYSPEIAEFSVYGINHGILSDDFFFRSSTSDERGHLYFGGTRGIDHFLPSEIRYRESPAITQIEGMRIFNRKVWPVGGNNLATDQYGVIQLSHRNNMVSFDYVALNFIEATRNRYFYMLEPIHDDWHFAGFERSVNFINLPPGNYTFRVKSCLGSSACDSGAAVISFRIHPPFWQRSGFVIAIAILFIVAMFWIQAAWSSNIRKKKIALQQIVEKRTRQLSHKNQELTEKSRNLAAANTQLSSLNSMKDRFFSIIGHDLRSPLSVLSGFSDIILNDYEKYDDKQRKELIGIIHDSVNKTVQLLDNLLQWAKSQTNRLDPKKEEVFPALVAEDVYTLHRELFINKDIEYLNQIPPDLRVVTDNAMLSVILRNLLTNAVKFTPSGGKVTVNASANGSGHVRFDIADTGKGIPPEIMESLFRIDSAATSQGTEGESGTGLGLILCHEFIQKLGGVIWVEETSVEGTTFSFTLPALA
jgi:signal transduction histidine kinase/ligand-binding sensor domain-containing protein